MIHKCLSGQRIGTLLIRSVMALASIGNLSLTSSAAAQPANDVCGNGQGSFSLSGSGGTLNGSFLFAGLAAGSGSCASNEVADVYCYFTPSTTGYYRFSTCGSSSVLDSILSIHTGCPATPNNLATGESLTSCNDNSCGTRSQFDGGPLTAGVQVVIRIAHRGLGSYQLQVSPSPLVGACCGEASGSCGVTIAATCGFAGGFLGVGTACSPNPCPQPGACCTNGVCTLLLVGACGGGSTFLGQGTACAPNPCPQPGACCTNFVCAQALAGDCGSGSTFFGAGTSCTPTPCPPIGACCDAGGMCTETTSIACDSGRTFLIAGACSPNPCTVPGACCSSSTGACVASGAVGGVCPSGGLFMGPNSTCSPNPCPAMSCANAQTIAAPFSTVRSTAGATISPTPFCDAYPVNGKTLWYRVVGDGTTLTASTCGTNTNFPTVINVYCAPDDTCGNGNSQLFCIKSGDPAPPGCNAGGGTGSRVSWFANAGVTYIVAAFGYQRAQGILDFSLTSAAGGSGAPCVSDRCPVDLTGVVNVEQDFCVGVEVNTACGNPDVRSFAFGTPFAGTCYNFGTLRDIDYWHLADTVPDTVGDGTAWLDIEFSIEYPGQMALFSGECGSPAFATDIVNYRALGTDCPRMPTVLHELVSAGESFHLLMTTIDFGGVPCAPGNNTYRLTVNPSTLGACCQGAWCSLTIPQACSFVGETFMGLNTVCHPVNACDVFAIGACCDGSICVVMSGLDCVGARRSFQGPASVCNWPGDYTVPCCSADFNQSGQLSVQDLFDYLGGYFSGDGTADINRSSILSVQDLFDFLAAYFAGCS